MAYATALGCHLGGAALLLVGGFVAVFSRQIADGFYGPRRSRDIITDRRPPNEDLDDSRRFYATLARWGIGAWGTIVAVCGLAVLVGLGGC